MALFNYATKEITLKVVYYGPGLSGKTTNLQYMHSVLNADTKGKLLSLATETDRTLFFDFLPVELGRIRDFTIRFQLYTVPGQVRYNATRKVVLKGADAVVFVADSQREMKDQNIESFLNMRDNLEGNAIDPNEIPVVLQYNKRDLQNILSVEEMNAYLNSYDYPFVEASAVSGAGVEESFKLITKILLKHISQKHKIEINPPKDAELVEEISQEEPEKLPEFPQIQPEPVPQPEVEEFVDMFDQRDFEPAVREKEEKEVWPVEAEPAAEIQASKADTAPVLETADLEPMIRRIVAEELARGFDDIRKQIIASAPKAEVSRVESNTAEEIEKVKALLSEIKHGLIVINKDLRNQNIQEVRTAQDETNNMLRAIVNIFEGLKTKKSWFKL